MFSLFSKEIKEYIFSQFKNQKIESRISEALIRSEIIELKAKIDRLEEKLIRVIGPV